MQESVVLMAADLEFEHVGAESDGEGRPSMIPGWRQLDGFALESRGAEGVAVESLQSGSTLIVQTVYSRYRIVVLDGPNRLVRIQGGRRLPDAMKARLEGATAGGSAIKRGWIVIGFEMEFSLAQRRIRSSRVRSVTTESCPSPCGTPSCVA
jgi:hypothetical protein